MRTSTVRRQTVKVARTPGFFDVTSKIKYLFRVSGLLADEPLPPRPGPLKQADGYLSGIHFHPSRSSGIELHFGPPRLSPQVHVRGGAMVAATACAIRPFRERDVQLGIIPAFEPNRLKTFAAICVGENGISAPQILVRQVTIHPDQARLERNDHTSD